MIFGPEKNYGTKIFSGQFFGLAANPKARGKIFGVRKTCMPFKGMANYASPYI